MLQLNYIVCVEETGADKQMAADKCWKTGMRWGHSWVEGFHGVVTALKGIDELLLFHFVVNM